jgi:hypothetical protein
VPRWWHFNETVLDRMREVAKASFDMPEIVPSSLDEVTIDDVGVTRFSQLVAESFTTASWFELLRNLEGTVPSPCHDALALLAKKGQLAAVVTTNFDKLIERALAAHDVPFTLRLGSEGGN